VFDRVSLHCPTKGLAQLAPGINRCVASCGRALNERGISRCVAGVRVRVCDAVKGLVDAALGDAVGVGKHVDLGVAAQLEIESKFESSQSHFSFRRLDPGALNVGLVGSPAPPYLGQPSSGQCAGHGLAAQRHHTQPREQPPVVAVTVRCRASQAW